MGKVNCEACHKKCKGQALKLPEEKYFHLKCFKCKECDKQLSSGGFFSKDNNQYCAEDYQKLFGTRCHACGKYVEGEVVTALGNTYHQECFRCTNCRKFFGPGDKVTYNGTEYLCHSCLDKIAPQGAVVSTSSPSHTAVDGTKKGKMESPSKGPSPTSSSAPVPARPHQIAIAQEQLNSPDSDYSTDIKDYTCDGHVIDGRSPLSPISGTSGYKSDASYDQTPDTSRDVEKTNYATGSDSRGYLMPNSQFMHYRSVSPGSTISHVSRKSKDSDGSLGSSNHRGEMNYGKFLRTSFLDKTDDFKRGPSINPVIHEKPPLHYHRPGNGADGFSYKKVRTDLMKPSKKASMQFLPVRRRNSEPYRPIKNQEAIQLAKLPDAHQHEKSQLLPIERDDFPAPPAPAAACPELLREHPFRRRSASGSMKGSRPDDNKENEGMEETEEAKVDPKVEREIQELSKLPESGAARMILEGLKKQKFAEPVSLDPRSASRTPSAAVEPHYRTRYESPIYASPSRDLELRSHLQSLDETFAEPKYRTCLTPVTNFQVPRPGYGLRSGTLDSRNEYLSDVTDAYYQTNFYPRRPGSSNAVLERSSCYSSQSDIEEYDPMTGLKRNSRFRSTVMSDGRITPIPYMGHRRSVPSIFKIEEPPKTYTYDELRLGNRHRRPSGLDKDRLEQYLPREEFEALFKMTHEEFYHLAEWKRNDIKMRIELF